MTSHSFSSSGHSGVCTWWIAYTFDNPLRRLIHKPQKVLGNFVKEGMTVMDLGCGMGHFSIGMAGLVGGTGRVIAVDLQQKMLDVMERRAQRAGLADRILPHLCQADDIGIEEQADFVLENGDTLEDLEIRSFALLDLLRARARKAEER